MNILAVDTATKSFSVAVMQKQEIRAEITGFRSRTHASLLMGAIEDCLKIADIAPEKLDGFGVTVGPGSFTGLRIGISAVKGLATALDKPCAGISTLRVLAWQAQVKNADIWPVIDARRNQVYTACFAFEEGRLVQKTPEMAVDPQKWVEQVSPGSYLLGDGLAEYEELIFGTLGQTVHSASNSSGHIRASALGELAYECFAEGGQVGPEALLPRYLRPSDARLPNIPQKTVVSKET